MYFNITVYTVVRWVNLNLIYDYFVSVCSFIFMKVRSKAGLYLFYFVYLRYLTACTVYGYTM